MDEFARKIDLYIDDFREATENISYQANDGYVTPDDLSVIYNTARPHGTLAYKTPEKYEIVYQEDLKNKNQNGQGVQKPHI